jgi:5-formaminoimidazole-4-carboxamide-1-beta-D-ribofuranosyl 5'-monophosphate synthetase
VPFSINSKTFHDIPRWVISKFKAARNAAGIFHLWELDNYLNKSGHFIFLQRKMKSHDFQRLLLKYIKFNDIQAMEKIFFLLKTFNDFQETISKNLKKKPLDLFDVYKTAPFTHTQN